MSRIRLGLIGSGSQGRYLSEAAAVTEAFEFVACADPDPQATAEAQRLNGYATAYSDARRMLASEALDAVVVATVHDQLQPEALAALRAGKHVLVEKPAALTAAAGQELVDAARADGLKLMVGYSLRFMPPRLLMRRLIDEGAIGDVRQIMSGQCIGAMGGWLGEKQHGGGPLYYIGAHALDQMIWVAGSRAERVSAEMNVADGGVELEAMVNIRFDNGVLGQLVASQTLGGRYGWIDVLGTQGRIRAQWESDSLWVQSGTIPEYAHLTEIALPPMTGLLPPPAGATAQLSGFAYVRTWATELKEFADAINDDRAPSVTGEDGVRVLEVLDAAWESAATGATVEVGG